MRRKAAGVALLLSCTIAFSSNAFAANRKLYLDIDFIPNLIFNLYDVEVYLDDNKIETISNGDDYTHLIDDVKEGKHTISFVSTDDSDIKGTYDFELTGDMTFQCTIESGDDSVDISDVNTIDNIDGSQLEVADYTGEILSSAKKALEDEGFTSVEGEAVDDSVWDEDNWIITEQNIEAGSRVDKSTEIILTCIKTQEYLDEKILQKNIPDANDQAEALGFKVSYVNDITDNDMSDRIDSMPDDEKANWKVVSIHPDSLGEKKASLNLLYYGKKAVPDVVGLSLSEALQTFDDNDFSSVSYSAVSGDSIWDTDNWKVISQSIDAGTEREADQKIELSVKSYKSIESEEAAASTENSEQQLQTGETPQSETKILETQAPETQAPETQAPETQAPETQAPETQAPETETPKTDPIDLTSAETIKAVQEALNNAGYDCGTADGVAGSRTRDAISRYRSENGLTAGTEIDAELIENLGIKGEPVKSSEISEEEARRALIVALSNYYAEDVFTDDGNNYDPSKIKL